MRRTITLVLMLGFAAGAQPREFRMKATAYTQRGQTALGTRTRRGVIAADPRVLPLGSKVRIEGAGRFSGEYRVEDTGRRVKGHKIDVFTPSAREAREFGKRVVRVRKLGTSHSRRN